MSNKAALDGVNVLLAAIRVAKTLGVNYQEVSDAQAVADAEDRELSADEISVFADQARSAVDRVSR